MQRHRCKHGVAKRQLQRNLCNAIFGCMDTTPTDEQEFVVHDRKLEGEALKALAHPLRVQIFDRLSVHGPATASGLAEALGESSGATSYHIRQLEKHGFVREVTGRGVGRERWWERTPGGISLTPEGREESESARAAADMVMWQWERDRNEHLVAFLRQGEKLDREWMYATLISTGNLRLTLEQAKDAQRIFEDAIDEVVRRYRGKDDPGARPVQFHVNLFPIMDGVATPEATITDHRADTAGASSAGDSADTESEE